MRKTFWEGAWRVVADDGLVAGRADEPSGDDVTVDASQIRVVKLKYLDKCPGCGAGMDYDDNKNCGKCKLTFGRFDAGAAPVRVVVVPPSPPGTRQYKVLTQRDEFFKSKFNPEALQDVINQHAAEGWRVVGMTATDVGSFFGSFWGKGGGANRQELIVLLEKVW